MTPMQSSQVWSSMCTSIRRRCELAGTDYLIQLDPSIGTRWFTISNMADLADTLNLIRPLCGVDGLPNVTVPSLIRGSWFEDIKTAISETNGFRTIPQPPSGSSVDGDAAQAAGGNLWDVAYPGSAEAQFTLWSNWNDYRYLHPEGSTWSYGTILSGSIQGYYGIYDSDWVVNSATASTMFDSAGRVMVRPDKNFFTMERHASWTDRDLSAIPFSGEDGMAYDEWGLYDTTTGVDGLHTSTKNYDRCFADTFPGYNLNWNILSPAYYAANGLTVRNDMLWLMDYDFGDEEWL